MEFSTVTLNNFEELMAFIKEKTIQDEESTYLSRASIIGFLAAHLARCSVNDEIPFQNMECNTKNAILRTDGDKAVAELFITLPVGRFIADETGIEVNPAEYPPADFLSLCFKLWDLNNPKPNGKEEQ